MENPPNSKDFGNPGTISTDQNKPIAKTGRKKQKSDEKIKEDEANYLKEREYKLDYKRHYDSLTPLKRSPQEKIALTLLQVALALITYYYSAYYNSSPNLFLNSYYMLFLRNEPVTFAHFSIFSGIFLLILYSKVFYKGTVIIGSFLGEMLIQRYYYQSYFHFLPAFIMILIILVPFLFNQYEGGEYAKGKGLIKEFIILLCIDIAAMIFIFTVYTYEYSVTLGIVFFVSFFTTVLIPVCVVFLILDKRLEPYFPFNEEEMQKFLRYREEDKQAIAYLKKQLNEQKKIMTHGFIPPEIDNAPYNGQVNQQQPGQKEGWKSQIEGNKPAIIEQSKDNDKHVASELSVEELADIAEGIDFYFGIHLLNPGEYYTQTLTHNTLYKDGHTMMFLLGKVRVYVCTRCTSMILGLIFALFVFHITRVVYGIRMPDEFYLYFNIFAPAVALLDWVLQKLAIRESTTLSRFISGMIVGFAMNNISQSPHLISYHIVITIIYFVIFFLFMIFGERRVLKF